MKIDILTFHRAYNYGAVLQCYALAKTVQNLGAECEVLDYWPDYFKSVYYYEKKFKITHPPVHTMIRKLLLHNVLKSRNGKFEKFIIENIPLSKMCYQDKTEMERMVSDCDGYITGSDQVWHYMWTDFDPIYFLDFPDAKNKKRYSYAASFGMDQLPEDKVQEYKRRLTGYDAYSVREKSGAVIINNLLKKEATVNCDPTFLLSKNEWESLCKPLTNNTPYILVYYTATSKKLQEYAQKLSKQKKCKVISFPCNMSKAVLSGKNDADYDFEVIPDGGPIEFLSLFRNASYVLTNTFHGTVFSIIFQRKFLSQLSADNGSKNVRVIDLLETLGIEHRDLCLDFDNIDNEIRWTDVQQKMSEIRNKGKSYLNEIVQKG